MWEVGCGLMVAPQALPLLPQSPTTPTLGAVTPEAAGVDAVQIFDSHGKLVDERELPLDLEQCRNYRRDYFLTYLIYLPDGLSSGNYRLELTVEDRKGTAAPQEPAAPRGAKSKEDKLAKTPSSASSYKGRKLGTGTIEFTIK